MIDYIRHELPNGLRILYHQDVHTPMAAVSVLYDVGSKDEDEEHTGYVHLFEHLMFAGSKHAPDFDDIIQDAGGENNAYTNCDMTHFYNILPAQNLETVLFLEADRMQDLVISKSAFNTQKKVVVEEFLETVYNQPYGDVWHHLLDVNYQKHTYRWPTIGLIPEHIEKAKRENVIRFYHSHYQPSNAILSIGGPQPWEEVLPLVEKYFGAIKDEGHEERTPEPEPMQTAIRRKEVEADVPHDQIYMTFKMSDRLSRNYYVQDILSDILSNGASSRLISHLVKDEQVFASIDAYVYGTTEPGLFIIEGQPMTGISLEEAEQRIWEELAQLKAVVVTREELDRQLNKVRTNLIMSETSLLGKIMSLAYFELLGHVDLINKEDEIYQDITPMDLFREAQRLFIEERCCVVYYKAKG